MGSSRNGQQNASMEVMANPVGGAATTTHSHLIHLGLSCQSRHPKMSTLRPYNVDIQHIWQTHGCICVSLSIIDHESYPNTAAGSSRRDEGLFEETLVLLFDMIFIIDHYGREQTKKNNDGDDLTMEMI